VTASVVLIPVTGSLTEEKLIAVADSVVAGLTSVTVNVGRGLAPGGIASTTVKRGVTAVLLVYPVLGSVTELREVATAESTVM